jgi:hypothetical protein
MGSAQQNGRQATFLQREHKTIEMKSGLGMVQKGSS